MIRLALAFSLAVGANVAAAQAPPEAAPLDGTAVDRRLPTVTPKPTFRDGDADDYRPAPAPRPAAPAAVPPPSVQPAERPALKAAVPNDACLTALKKLAKVERAVSPEADDPGCVARDPVRMSAIRTEGTDVVVSGAPILTCRFATAFAHWTRDIAAPVAQGALDRRLTRIGTGPGFQCRRRNRAATGKLSEHAIGNAIDITAFRFATSKGENGGKARLPVVPYDRLDAEQVRYLHAVRRAACGYFNTILGPGSDTAHATHLHLDLGRSYRKGELRKNPYKICD